MKRRYREWRSRCGLLLILRSDTFCRKPHRQPQDFFRPRWSPIIICAVSVYATVPSPVWLAQGWRLRMDKRHRYQRHHQNQEYQEQTSLSSIFTDVSRGYLWRNSEVPLLLLHSRTHELHYSWL
ncbi:hypothetical protein OBBRIDRAFT_481201 [Obba rivulosa]|uniref:Uncharacterized protein n=1 Tax=Obba rivulosa TaxID=1052685 RepID=A0A8E2AWX0_9APHY|nr:hypothetical protein OBBRIDRAFT_481201 [Obba rivulosa]